MAEDSCLRILLLGHSYIRRLGQFMEASPAFESLGFQGQQVQVFYFGLGGARLSVGTAFNHCDLENALSCKPHVVYIHLGCNDLKITTAEEISARLIDLATYISSKPGVRIVCVSQIFPFPSTVQFLESIKKVNDSVKTKFSDVENIIYWRHRGFWKPEENLFLDDQTHLNLEGRHRYWTSVRFAVKFACSRLMKHLI